MNDDRRVFGSLPSLGGSAMFFVRSPLRSWRFVLSAVIYVAFVTVDLTVLFMYSSRMPSGSSIFLILFLVGSAAPVGRTLHQHSRINELYLAGKMGDVDPASPIHVALEVASDALNDGIFYLFTTLFATVVFIWTCVRHAN
ncbi:MAG: hypothetical protein WCD23_16625 [Candidatus Acidiferrales bacterium]